MTVSNLMSFSWGGSQESSSEAYWAKSKKEAEEVFENAGRQAYNAQIDYGAGVGAQISSPTSPFQFKAPEAHVEPLDLSKDRDRDRDREDDRERSRERSREHTPNEESEHKGHHMVPNDREAHGSGSDAVVANASHNEPAAQARVQHAVAKHLNKHGVPEKESKEISKAIAPKLSEELAAHEKGSDAHVMFYPEGEVAAAIESRHPMQDFAVQNQGAIAVSMDTLKDVHEQGMPEIGVGIVRDQLAADVHGMSDLDILNRFGHDSVSSIEQDGFPTEMVDELQQTAQQRLEMAGVDNPSVSKAQALEVLGDVARGEKPEIEIQDEATGFKLRTGASELREQMGFPADKAMPVLPPEFNPIELKYTEMQEQQVAQLSAQVEQATQANQHEEAEHGSEHEMEMVGGGGAG